MGGRLLVTDQHVPDGRVVKRVVDGQNGTAGITKYDVNAVGHRAVDDQLRTRLSIACRVVLVVAWGLGRASRTFQRLLVSGVEL